MNRGNAFSAKGDTEHALADLETAMRMEPRNAEAYDDHAVQLIKSGRLREAIPDLDHAIAIHPDPAHFAVDDYYFNRGLVHLNLREFQAAEADFTSAIGLNPQRAEFFYSRGQSRGATDQLEKAVEDFIRATQLQPAAADGYVSLGVAYSMLKRTDEAIASFESAIRLVDNPAAIAQLRAEIERLKARAK